VKSVLPLNDGTHIPRIGLGTWPMNDAEAQVAVSVALQIGYRLIDTASGYGNELGVGRGIRASGVPREQVFLTSKLRGADHGYSETLRGLDASLERLGTSYIDLYLIHWPLPMKDLYVDSWRALIHLKAEGLVRSIGVSNFLPQHIYRIVAETGVRPAVNQLELHPGFTQRGLRDWHARNGIQIESYSPLGRGALLSDPLIVSLARKHNREPAQVILRWHLQRGLVAIPKSQDPQRMRRNLDVFNFELDTADLAAIAALDGNQRQGGDPETFDEE
jgi:2,5-diketo-D-gluconate reductase A